MKKLILSMVLAAFAVSTQAADAQCCAADKEKPACCAKMKAGEQAKAEACPMAKKDAKATCPFAKAEAKETAAKKQLPSPKNKS